MITPAPHSPAEASHRWRVPHSPFSFWLVFASLRLLCPITVAVMALGFRPVTAATSGRMKDAPIKTWLGYRLPLYVFGVTPLVVWAIWRPSAVLVEEAIAPPALLLFQCIAMSIWDLLGCDELDQNFGGPWELLFQRLTTTQPSESLRLTNESMGAQFAGCAAQVQHVIIRTLDQQSASRLQFLRHFEVRSGTALQVDELDRSILLESYHEQSQHGVYSIDVLAEQILVSAILNSQASFRLNIVNLMVCRH